jgi:beta-lactamase superfamily II metal-dependent hydrolase
MADTIVFADKPETILREQPNASAKVLNHVLMGTWLKVVDEGGSFFKVETRKAGPGGWVLKNDVRSTPILKIFYVDVGQGDGAIIEYPTGIMLIDGGPNKSMFGFMLHRYGPLFDDGEKVHIDALVMSHPDSDHFTGLTPVLNDQRFTIGTIFHNGIIRYNEKHPDVDFDLGKLATRTIDGQHVEVLTETINTLSQAEALLAKSDASPTQDPKLVMSSYYAFWDAAKKAHEEGRLQGARRVTSRDATLPGFSSTSPDDLRVEVLGPVPTKPSGSVELMGFAEPEERDATSQANEVSSSHTRNGHSVVLKLIFGNHSFLFGGDLNIPAERHLLSHYGMTNPFQCDVAKACHHGSSDFTVDYLKKVRPHVNVFSSGDNKSFDHPVADALGAAGQHASGEFPLLFSTELARATTSHGIHFGLINARSNGTVLTMAQMKEQHNKADVWDSFTVPWKGKFKES